MQRCVTKCDYDHIGIILRYSDNEIVLFEATGNVFKYYYYNFKKDGVGLLPWKNFL